MSKFWPAAYICVFAYNYTEMFSCIKAEQNWGDGAETSGLNFCFYRQYLYDFNALGKYFYYISISPLYIVQGQQICKRPGSKYFRLCEPHTSLYYIFVVLFFVHFFKNVKALSSLAGWISFIRLSFVTPCCTRSYGVRAVRNIFWDEGKGK